MKRLRERRGSVDPAEMLEEDLTALMQRLQEQEQVAAENHDKFLRTMAEFDNFRKRSRQEMEDAQPVRRREAGVRSPAGAGQLRAGAAAHERRGGG